MKALAELTAEKGYEATKISDIVRRAGVARKTLYDNFEGKEEVFLAAFDDTRDEVLRRVKGAAAAAEGDWKAQIEAGLGAFLGYVAEEPTLARMFVIEALSATPVTTKRYEETLDTFVTMARETLPRDEGQPETIAESLVGGVRWIVYKQIFAGEAEQAEDLLPELTDFMVAPFLGGLNPVAGVDKRD